MVCGSDALLGETFASPEYAATTWYGPSFRVRTPAGTVQVATKSPTPEDSVDPAPEPSIRLNLLSSNGFCRTRVIEYLHVDHC
jgi:hypothetical protein